MNLLKRHEIRYTEKNTADYKRFGNVFFDKGELFPTSQVAAFRREKSKVYFGKTYEEFPDSLLIPPEQHTVNEKLIWEYSL